MKKISLHRLLRLRQRYILTRDNRVRLRYVVSSALVCALCISQGMSYFSSQVNAAAVLQDIEPAGGSVAMAVEEFEEVDVAVKMDEINIGHHISEGIRKASAAIKKPEQPRFREIELKSGQTVAGLLQNAGLSGTEAYKAVEALQEFLDVRKVRSGQKIGLHYQPANDGSVELSKMEMRLDPIKQVSITRSGPQEFLSAVEEKELYPRTYARKAEIETSLYGSAALANIPRQVVAELIRIYSWDIDFQRDIRRGDTLEILYEAYETEDGEFARYGNILYANLSVGGRKVPIYRYEMKDGSIDYFQPDGMSIRKSLMKTPIDGARISSGFGMRHHPVLGYNKMHKGMDFAAPTGTPIYAAGDGVVDYAGRKGAYGNYVRIRHNSKLQTAYAHMHKINAKVRKGSRVRQGEVIGYVGTTGRSTGPHLHYEVLKAGVQVNPRSVDLPTGEQLMGNEMKNFRTIQGAVYQQYRSLAEDMEIAFATISKDQDDIPAEDGDTFLR